MRTEYSIKNTITIFVTNFISFFVAFLSQAFFIRILGAEYLGLNGLFSNILTMLSLFELGIGSAIVFNLYKPIAKNDQETIKSLMQFYKKAYNIISILVFCFGLAIVPFLRFIVGEISIPVNIYIVYFLFLISTVASYMMAYKRSLLIAMQRSYVINIIHSFYLVILNVVQILVIYLTKNYYLYLMIKIICIFVENIWIMRKANKDYPYLLDKNVKKLDKTIEKDIFSRVKALIFHKIGTVIVNGTDNILISMFFGVVTVGLYSNYFTVINAINVLFGQAITSLTASIGNLLVQKNVEKNFQVFKRLRFANFWIATFSGTALFVVMQPFICVWVGEKYLLSNFVLFVLVFNYYQKMMRNCYGTFKDSAGIWREDKFVPLIESVLNIFASLVCLKIFGLAGVFIGTIISGFALWMYSYPKFVYKKIFHRTYLNYAKETIGYLLLFLVISFFTFSLSNMITVSNLYLKLFINIFLSVTIPNILIFLCFRKTSNFQYFLNLFKNIIVRKKHA